MFAVGIVLSAQIILAQSVKSQESAPTQEMVTLHRDIEFATVDSHSLKLDLYVPQTSSRPPMVVWIHGGGWRGGSKNKTPLKNLTEHGFAVASISYRFTDRAIFPAQIYDCKGAIRWLRAHAEEYRYDASWLAVAGSSAGGHLALLLGTSGGVAELEGDVGGHLDQSSVVQAVIDYFGPSDFVLRAKTQPERAYTELSGSFALLGGVKSGAVDKQLEVTASPVHYVTPQDPPLLVFQGTADETVLPDQSERIVAAYREHGLQAELVLVEGAKHGGAVYFSGNNFDRAVEFLKRCRQP
jgi:acetyl esterase/lipase